MHLRDLDFKKNFCGGETPPRSRGLRPRRDANIGEKNGEKLWGGGNKFFTKYIPLHLTFNRHILAFGIFLVLSFDINLKIYRLVTYSESQSRLDIIVFEPPISRNGLCFSLSRKEKKGEKYPEKHENGSHFIWGKNDFSREGGNDFFWKIYTPKIFPY